MYCEEKRLRREDGLISQIEYYLIVVFCVPLYAPCTVS
jgi:hypothetical protein